MILRGTVTLYFVRHGETASNAENRLQGQLDVPLNDKGRGQAERNGRKLHELIRDVSAVDFVASPLARARETMEIARGAMGLERTAFRTDDRLKEIHFGRWQGLLWSEVPAFDPVGFAEREAGTFDWLAPGGESYAGLMARTVDWLGSVERDTVVVAHGGISRVLRGHLLGLPPHDVPTLKVPQNRVLILRPGTMEWA